MVIYIKLLTFFNFFKLVKTPRILKEYEEPITNDPQEATEILFGNISEYDISTFERMWDAIHSDKFQYTLKVNMIIDKFVYYVSKTTLELPIMIKNSYPGIYKKYYKA